MPDGDFFLEGVEHVQRLLKSNRVHRSIRVSVLRLHDFKHAWTEALPRLRCRRGSTELCDTEGVSHVLLDRRGKAQEVALGRPDPMQRFLVGSLDTSH